MFSSTYLFNYVQFHRYTTMTLIADGCWLWAILLVLILAWEREHQQPTTTTTNDNNVDSDNDNDHHDKDTHTHTALQDWKGKKCVMHTKLKIELRIFGTFGLAGAYTVRIGFIYVIVGFAVYMHEILTLAHHFVFFCTTLCSRCPCYTSLKVCVSVYAGVFVCVCAIAAMYEKMWINHGEENQSSNKNCVLN